jgi:predicted TIM-barrel fold metal-dependent hydrolase
VGVFEVTVESRSDQLLPDPEPRPVEFTIISVDDHLVEPPDMFEGRLPARFAPYQPRVVEDAEGHQLWEFDGELYTQVGMNAVAGRRPESVTVEPTRFEDMRPGCYDIDARIKDTDINGVWASLNFPSQIAGFAGRVFSGAKDPELGLAVIRAWNDWMFEGWWQPYPDRIIPCGITFLTDPALGAAEIRRNAKRGFRSVSLPERPQRLGLPHLFSDYWDPIIAACEETETVVSLHVGSSGQADLPDIPPGGTMMGLGATLFGQLSLSACAEWLWSGLPVRYPNVKIAMSEGGIGWVAMLLDRLDNIVTRSGYGRHFDAGGLTPAEVLLRNFYFCTLDTRARIGIDHVMVEVDYPHGDSTWPDTQKVIHDAWGHIPVDELRKLTHENAAALFRWPLPEDRRPL